jgi:hypothetical protein
MQCLSVALSIIIGLTSCFGQTSVMNQGHMISRNVYHEIRLTKDRDEIIESVSVNNTPFRFILDTGAPLSISKEIQDERKYPVLHRVPVYDANQNNDTISIVIVDTIRVGNITFADIPAIVLDFKNSPMACDQVDGIIGSNMVRFLIIQFNLNEKKIILTDQPDKILPRAKNFPVKLDDQSNAFLQVTLNTGFYDTPHFDSGMREFYHLNIEKAEQLILTFGARNSIASKGFGVTGLGIFGSGEPHQQYVLQAELKLGESLIKKCLLQSTQAASRLGRELLRYGTLTIDYPGAKYYFEHYTNRKYKKNPDFGFKPITAHGKVTVGVVWENTPAHLNGLTAGSELISINNKSFEGLNPCQIDNLLITEFAGKKIHIAFRKSDSIFGMVLNRIK